MAALQRVLCVLYAVLLLAVAGCQGDADGAPVPPTPETPPLRSILECGMGALTGPLGASPNALRLGAVVYEAIDDGMNVLGAVERAFGKDLREFTHTELEEALLILTGLDSCGDVSPMLRESLLGAIRILRSIIDGARDERSDNYGPVLCRGIYPLEVPQNEWRFEPNCGGPSIEGDWSIARANLSCVNLPEGCASSPLPLRFESCTANQCEISRADDLWRTTHAITEDGQGYWRAEFTDIAVQCENSPYAANIVIELTVTDSRLDGETLRASSLSGSYSVAAATIPGCTGDASAEWSLVGSRS